MAKKSRSKRGQKTCPSCKKTLGARTLTCSCGHEFSTARRSKKSQRSPLDFSLEELEEMVKAKKELAAPLGKLTEKYGVDVVLAEVQRMTR